MFTFSGSQDQKQAAAYFQQLQLGARKSDLQKELFEALKCGHVLTAQRIVEMGTDVKTLVPFHVADWSGRCPTRTWCKSPMSYSDYVSDYFEITADTLLEDNQKLFGHDGKVLSEESLEKFVPEGYGTTRNVFFDPLCYFIIKKNFAAAAFLVRNGYPLDVPKDDNDKSFRREPLCRAIYQENIPLIELMLEYGVRPTGDQLQTALWVQKPAIVKLLVRHGANVAAGKEYLSFLVHHKSYDFDGLERDTYDALYSALLTPVWKKRREEAVAPAVPDHQVVVESPMADMTMQEIYDFQRKERVTLFKQGGDIKNSLRQTFNELGHNDEGLKKAIAVYTERHPGFDAHSLFAKPSTFKIVGG